MGKLSRIRWDERDTPETNARSVLPGVVSEYYSRVRKLLSKDPSPADLHKARLATKRLRYSLELFKRCYGPGLDARMAGLRKLQQSLGDVNDCAASTKVVENSMPNSPQRVRVLRFLEQQAHAKADEFRKEWTEVFDAPGQEEHWATYLARGTRRK